MAVMKLIYKEAKVRNHLPYDTKISIFHIASHTMRMEIPNELATTVLYLASVFSFNSR
jgi:hypothetical protein